MTTELRAETLSLSVRGRVLRAADAEFDSARHIWNGMIDRRPALIVRAAGAADVVAAVNFARDENLPLAIRGGGHSASGTSVSDGGLMLERPGGRIARAIAGDVTLRSP